MPVKQNKNQAFLIALIKRTVKAIEKYNKLPLVAIADLQNKLPLLKCLRCKVSYKQAHKSKFLVKNKNKSFF